MPKKRYYTAQQIRADIDKWKAKARGLMDSAAALDLKADQFFKAGEEYKEDAVWHREQAKKKRASALRIEHRKLVRLKEKLAEFYTKELPGMETEDHSIQAT